jgi:short-subunit dehydrogenase
MALCPGVTETNFFAAAKMDHPPMRLSQTPEQVVETALRGLKRKKGSIISGWTNRLVAFSVRLFPRWVVLRLTGKILRKRVG